MALSAGPGSSLVLKPFASADKWVYNVKGQLCLAPSSTIMKCIYNVNSAPVVSRVIPMTDLIMIMTVAH